MTLEDITGWSGWDSEIDEIVEVDIPSDDQFLVSRPQTAPAQAGGGSPLISRWTSRRKFYAKIR